MYSRHLAGGDWVKAESALANLSALQTSLEIQLWKAELNFRLGDMELTRSILTDIIEQFEKVCSIFLFITFMQGGVGGVIYLYYILQK